METLVFKRVTKENSSVHCSLKSRHWQPRSVALVALPGSFLLNSTDGIHAIFKIPLFYTLQAHLVFSQPQDTHRSFIP